MITITLQTQLTADFDDLEFPDEDSVSTNAFLCFFLEPTATLPEVLNF